MKKIILIIAMLFVLISAKAQTRSSTIYNKRGLIMMVQVDVQSSDSTYYVASRDSRYYSIISFVTIAHGDKDDIKEILLFYKEVILAGKGYSDQLYEYHAMYSSVGSTPRARISDDGSGYTYITIKSIDKLLLAIE